MMGTEKDEEIGMDGDFEGGGGAPVATATPPQAEPVSSAAASGTIGVQGGATSSTDALGFDESPTVTGTPDKLGDGKDKPPQTQEQLQAARDESWKRGEIPAEILEASKGGPDTDKKHGLRLKHARAEYSETNGVVNASLNLTELKKNSQSLYNEVVAHGAVSRKYGEDDIDVFFEFGGSDAYSKFAFNESEKTGDKTLRRDRERGIIPEEHVTADMIADAHDLWLANQKLTQLLVERDDPQGNRDALLKMGDEGPVADGGQQTEVIIEGQPAGQKKIEEAEKLAARIEEAEKIVKMAQEKVAKDKKELIDIKQKNKVISDNDAAELLKTLAFFDAKIQTLKDSLNDAAPEKKDGIEDQLSEARKQKAEIMLTAIGYSVENAKIMLSRKNNLDTDLAVFLQLAKHTSLSKEQNSPNITELNRIVKMELLQSITDVLNKEKPEGEKQTWEQVRVMKAGEALRAAMKALGFDTTAQDKKVKELVESANNPERNLNISEEDPLHTMIESLVSGKPTADAEKDMEDWVKRQLKEFEEGGENEKTFDEWIKEKFKETFNSRTTDALALYISHITEEKLNFGSFMAMLLVGESYGSLAHDLGYKSKEELIKEGATPIDEEDIDRYIRSNDAMAQNARVLLCAGLKNIVRDDELRSYIERPSPTAVLSDENFQKKLTETFSKENHSVFVMQILEKLGYSEKDQASKKIKLTDTAVTYILSLPKLSHTKGWTDSVGGGEKKDVNTQKNEPNSTKSKT